MAEIGFYHLLTTPLDRALPRLLERARAQGYRIVVRAASPDRVEHLNAVLWTYDEASFLPHGSARDGNAAEPADLADRRGRQPERGDDAGAGGRRRARRLDFLSPAVPTCSTAATLPLSRPRATAGAALKAAGHTLTYWQQTGAGWEKKG